MSAEQKIYSCDDHIDLWALPPSLWEERLPKGLRERGPRVVQKPEQDFWVAGDVLLGASRMTASKGYSAILRAGIEDDGLRASNPELRLQDMDLDGVYSSVIYGPSLLGLQIPDLELKAECLRAYNDWAGEFNAHDRNRLCVLPVLPAHDPKAAIAELERVAKLGHRGAILYVFETRVTDPGWEPLWSAAASLAIPISFHIGGGMSLLKMRPESWELAAWSACAPIQLDEALAAMIFSGALERNPKMKLVLAEAGIGWVPYIVERMDMTAEKHVKNAKDYRLKAKPSEIFKQQVLVTFEEEPLGPKLIPLLGADSVMWASDYPHPDSPFPHSRQAIEEAFAGLDPEIRRKATAENCRKLYF
ncbi:MAG: amidohydrolase [Deltaproteobacteria bacterium]|nr:amidohydrolase [Deltaproteobacteria bacterium]